MEQRERTTRSLGKVLIADDDPDFRGMLARRAIRMGLEVVAVDDGLKAMQAIQDHRFHALVVDLYMPGYTGLEVIVAAQKDDPDLASLLLTASATVETAVEALRKGVHDYLTKPLESLSDFELALTRALEHRYLKLENKRLFAEVQRLAMTDPLTKLYNRHKLKEALETEVERASRYDRPVALIMIDLDKMKIINDTYGHAAGDAVLKLVADSIRRELRKLDVAARFGGDEFVVLLPEADLEQAQAVAQRICDHVQAARYKAIDISASFGVAQWRPDLGTIEAFVKAADAALYDSKHQGGGRVTMTEDSLPISMETRLSGVLRHIPPS